MGKLVAFWSPLHGQAKTTASMVAVAVAMNSITGDSVTMFHTQRNLADLEGMLDNRMALDKRTRIYEGAGLNALLLDFKRTELTKELVLRSLLPTAINKLSFLPGLDIGASSVNMNEVEKIVYRLTTKDIPNAFDWAFVDLSSGSNPLSLKIMERADVVVVTLSQNAAVWERFFEMYGNIADMDNVFYLIGGHVPESTYNIKNFRRIYHIEKGMCGTVPESVDYMDAISKGVVPEFFLMNEQAKKKEENARFIQESKDAARKIRDIVYSERRA